MMVSASSDSHLFGKDGTIMSCLPAYRTDAIYREVNMDRYLNKLKQEIQNKKYSDEYAQICVVYASRLLNSDLPVIFDMDHLCLLIGIKKSDLVKFIYADHCFYSQVHIPKKSCGFQTKSIIVITP